MEGAGTGIGGGIRRGGSRTNPPDEVLSIPELSVENSDGSGERVGTFRLRAVVGPGVERLDLLGGEVGWMPWWDSVELLV